MHSTLNSGGNNARNWITRGGRGGDGIVAIHVRVNNRAVLLQPMRGDPAMPMSVRSPLMDGMSMVGLSWKWADENALLRIQVMTNGVNESNIEDRSKELSDGWEDNAEIDFSKMSAEERAAGSTNIVLGYEVETSEGARYTVTYRSPISGIVRVLIDTNRVNYARVNATNETVSSMYGAVGIINLLVMDEPPLDTRSWWGWNIMPTASREYGSLYDHMYDTTVDIAPGRSCALNFSGLDNSTDPEDDPKFADTSAVAQYNKHDPFIQTPGITNGTGIGQVSFQARMLETNGVNGWVTISGSANSDAGDEGWQPITNIEIKADSPFFKPYLWRMPAEHSDYTTVRLTAWAAKDGRYATASVYAQDGNKIQRVLIDDVLVTQWIGLEGTSIIAKEKEKELLKKFPSKMIYDAINFDKYLSVIPEAATAVKSGVSAMHDVT